MEMKEIVELSVPEIESKIRSCRENLVSARLKKHLKDASLTRQLRELRKDIARYETVLTQKKATAKGGQ